VKEERRLARGVARADPPADLLIAALNTIVAIVLLP
jgi:hypothetical protein